MTKANALKNSVVRSGNTQNDTATSNTAKDATSNVADDVTNNAADESNGTKKTATNSKAPKKNTKSQPQTIQMEMPMYPAGYVVSDGPTEMYIFWYYKEGVWLGPIRDYFAAKQAGNGIVEPVKVWVRDNKFDHYMSTDEIIKYWPR